MTDRAFSQEHVPKKICFLFLTKTCVVCTLKNCLIETEWDRSFEHLKHMLQTAG